MESQIIQESKQWNTYKYIHVKSHQDDDENAELSWHAQLNTQCDYLAFLSLLHHSFSHNNTSTPYTARIQLTIQDVTITHHHDNQIHFMATH